jgi:hypothetical protein
MPWSLNLFSRIWWISLFPSRLSASCEWREGARRTGIHGGSHLAGHLEMVGAALTEVERVLAEILRPVSEG